MTGKSGFVVGFESIMLGEAERAAERALNSTRPRDAGGNALVAILLAVAGFEALVGTWAAIFRDDYGIDAKTLSMWRSRPINEVVKDILDRLKPPVRVEDLSWYAPLCAIIKLRNHVAHYLPEVRAPGEWPPEILGLITGKLFEPAGDETMDWTSRLLVGSVAQQVVKYAKGAIDGFENVAWRAA